MQGTILCKNLSLLRAFVQCDVVFFFETSILKEARILVYLRNSIIMPILNKVPKMKLLYIILDKCS